MIDCVNLEDEPFCSLGQLFGKITIMERINVPISEVYRKDAAVKVKGFYLDLFIINSPNALTTMKICAYNILIR